jgi:hypothetical protein
MMMLEKRKRYSTFDEEEHGNSTNTGGFQQSASNDLRKSMATAPILEDFSRRRSF